MHDLGRVFIAPDRNAGAAQLLYVVDFKIWLAAVTEYVRKRANRTLLPVCDAWASSQKKTAGFPPPSRYRCLRRDQRSNCNTLCCEVLASASADTAIDWRVDSAWLLAASSLVSANVRLDEPVCSTLIRFLEKSWRICTIDRFEPRADASERSVVLAALSDERALLAELLSRKSVP